MNKKNTAATDGLLKQYMVLRLEENVLRTSVYVFLILVMKVS